MKPVIGGIALGSALVLASCAHVDKAQSDIAQKRDKSKEVLAEPVKLAPEPRITKVDRPLLPLVERPLPKAGSWLRSKTVSISVANSVSLSQVVDMFATRGVSIISEIPLDNIYYAGTVPTVDAETALQVILGSCGLDFVVDETTRIVRIKPMPSRTWYLNLGQRRSRYASGSSGGATSTASTTNAASALLSATGSTTSTGTTSSPSTSSSAGEVSVSSSDDFWTSLHAELDRRLNLLVPSSRGPRNLPTKADDAQRGASQAAPSAQTQSENAFSRGSTASLLGGTAQTTGQAPQQPASTPGAQDMYSKKMMGGYSTNPETGAVTVQAPHWILSELDGYFTRVQQMYNTDITFTGELVLVNNSRNDSEGLDIAAFARYASKYGAVVANNSLGGVTVSFQANSKIPSVAAGNAGIGGTLIGITDPSDGLQIFNAWLAESGDASVIQRPVVSTTSGMPAEFSKTVTRYYNTVNQQTAAGGTGSAAVGTQNTLVPVNLGTSMRINPRFDMTSGLIRTQLSFTQSVQSASQNITQTVTAGTALQSITSTIPVVTQIAYSGETLLRNGDLIIVGGQSEENLSADESGLPEKTGFLNYILGTRKSQRSGGTFYLALRVQITPR